VTGSANSHWLIMMPVRPPLSHRLRAGTARALVMPAQSVFGCACMSSRLLPLSVGSCSCYFMPMQSC